MAQFFNSHQDQLGSLVGIGLLVLANPGYMFADIGHFKHIWIKPGPFHGFSESGLMHSWRTGCDNNAIQPFFLDGLLNCSLTRFGTGVHGVVNVGHIRIMAGRFRDFGTIYRPPILLPQ